MRRLKEDPEVLFLALVVALFVGCLLALRPNREIIDRALRIKHERAAQREAWLQEHPIWRGMRLGLALDGGVTNLAWQVEHLFIKDALNFEEGRFGQGLRCALGTRVVARDFLIRPAATWAMWARIDNQVTGESAMHLVDCNGCSVNLGGGRLRAGVFDGQWKELSVESPETGRWFHVAMTWGGGDTNGEVTLYLDGVAVRSRAYAGRISYPYRSLVMGAAHDYTRPFGGVLDEVCVFDRVLAPEEIAALAWVGLARLAELPAREVSPEFVRAQRAMTGLAPPTEAAVARMPAEGLYRELALGYTFERYSEAGGGGNPMSEATSNMNFDVSGQFGRAARFDGAGRIRVPDLAIAPAGTWALWMRPADDYDRASTMRILDVNGTGMQLEGQQLTAFLYEEAGTHYAACLATTGGWFHVAMAWGQDEAGKGVFQLFKDGVLQQTSDFGGKPGFPMMPLMIGCAWDANRYFRGDLDDVCVFNRRLAEAEIRELMNRGLADWEERQAK